MLHISFYLNLCSRTVPRTPAAKEPVRGISTSKTGRDYGSFSAIRRTVSSDGNGVSENKITRAPQLNKGLYENESMVFCGIVIGKVAGFGGTTESRPED